MHSHSHEATGTFRLINMQSFSREATVTPILLNMQSPSREVTGTVTPFDKYAESQSRSDCCQILLNMQRHSRDYYAAPTRRSL